VAVVRLLVVHVRWLRTVSFLLSLALRGPGLLKQADLVHVHLCDLDADLAVLGAMAMRRPVYLKVAAGGAWGEVQRLRRIPPVLRYLGLRHASAVQALSDEIAEELESAGVGRERVVRIANGIDVSAYGRPADASRAAIRERLGLPLDRVLTLFVGRLARHRGILDLPAAWDGELSSRATLVVVGSSSTIDPAGRLEPKTGVIARDWTTEIRDYFNAVDGFVLPSYVEGMSNALLEAMASRLPVIASRVGAAESMIADGENGLLVRPGQRQELAAALRRVVSEPAQRARLGARASESVGERYSIERVVDRVELAYSRLRPPR